jgi:hypothetical protein
MNIYVTEQSSYLVVPSGSGGWSEADVKVGGRASSPKLHFREQLVSERSQGVEGLPQIQFSHIIISMIYDRSWEQRNEGGAQYLLAGDAAMATRNPGGAKCMHFVSLKHCPRADW